MASVSLPINVTIDGMGLIEKIGEVIKPMLEDDRIPEKIREEYKSKLENAIDSWDGTKSGVEDNEF
jgi:hypothetical protein